MDTNSGWQRPVTLAHVNSVLRLAEPTQRLLAFLYQKHEVWPGVPIYEKFAVIQDEANLPDLDLANAIQELSHHRIIESLTLAQAPNVLTHNIIQALRDRFVHGPQNQKMMLDTALIQFRWTTAESLVRQQWQKQTPEEQVPEEQKMVGTEPSIPEASVPQAATSYRLVFRDGKPIRVAEGEAPPPESEAQVEPDGVELEDVEEAANGTQKAGWVYVLRVGRNYKIGKTINLNQRMTQLRIQLPEKPEVIHTIQTNDIDWVERHWHRCFAARRKNGEWFRLMPNEVDEIKSIKRMDVER